ncbi:MAG: BlaI/MecI/CopY family transcriptional regulator [Lachnospiraceae bacterium]|nr:BlaI/MecI/CopY family transcriptional regulator [Lachnospiraceae bacterium]
MIVQISDSELELMKIIWANGGTAFYAQIMAELEKTDRIWQKNTIMTFLSRLISKGFIKSHKMGRRNEYTALISEIDYQAVQTQNFLNKLYEGNAKGLIATMIQRDMLTTDDYEELKRFWEGKRDE